MTNPMGSIAAAQQRLVTALGTVAGIIVQELGQTVSPPAVIVGPPALSWTGYGGVAGVPTTCTWNVYLVMAVNQYSVDNLLAMVATVTAAIESYSPAVVLSAGPGTYSSSTGALPAYVIVAAMEPATF